MLLIFIFGLLAGIAAVLVAKSWLAEYERDMELIDLTGNRTVDKIIPILYGSTNDNIVENSNNNNNIEALSQPTARDEVIARNDLKIVKSLVRAGILSTAKRNKSTDIVNRKRSTNRNNYYVNVIGLKNSTITDRNVFLPVIFASIRSADDFVGFSGRNVKAMFGTEGKFKAVLELNGKTKARNWADVSNLLKQTIDSIQLGQYWKEGNVTVNALHVHNEHKLGDFVELMTLQHMKQNGRQSLNNRVLTEEELRRVLDLTPVPIVLTNSIDENWGFFSTGIGTRTAHWLNLTNHLIIHKADYSTIRYLLSSEKIVLIQANGHVDPQIGYHPKRLPPEMIAKNKWLVINNSGWGDREAINEMVSIAFNRTVVNSYSGTLNRNVGKRDKKHRKSDNNHNSNRRQRRLLANNNINIDSFQNDYNLIPKHMMETVRSRYVLCPSGLSMDSYRLWETLVMGSIPIVESNKGMDRMYSHLPVLVVSHYSQVTPELLQYMYPCFMNYLKLWRFEQLTQRYWINLFEEALATGSNDHVLRNHPPEHICVPPIDLSSVVAEF